MILKRMCCGPALVPPWGLVYGIKKDVLPLSLQASLHPPVPPWGLVYDIKKDVLPLSLQTLPAPSGATVGIGI